MKKLGNFETRWASLPVPTPVYQGISWLIAYPELSLLLNPNFVSPLEFGYSFILKYHRMTSSYINSNQRKIILTMVLVFSGNLSTFHQDSLIISSNLLEITKHQRTWNHEWIYLQRDINKKGVDHLFSLFFLKKSYFIFQI